MSSTKLSAYCSKVIEAGWIAAMVLVPLYFNVYSSRVFEPDKLTLLRSIAVFMSAAWLVKTIEEASQGREAFHTLVRAPLMLPTLALVVVYLLITLTSTIPLVNLWVWGSIVAFLVAAWRLKVAFWRMPLVLPALALVVIYLFTTLTSVAPFTSLWGSYQRLQGTYTTLSYIVVFFLILNEMRSREQLDRLITIAIITSVPISLYGLIQHYGIDPLPWGGDVTRRVASNMGNAIFISAYEIMILFLTLGRIVEAFIAILTEEEGFIADILRASAYIFVALIQLITIWFSQSRGPLLGLLAGAFTFVLFGFLALRNASPDKGALTRIDLTQALGALVGLAFVGAVLGLLMVGGAQAIDMIKDVSMSTMRTAGLSVGATMGGAMFSLLLVGVRRTWKWLWLVWVTEAVLVAGFFVLFNLPDSPLSPLRDLPYIGRLGKVFQTEGGTGKVRVLIWEGAVDMISPHEELGYPPTSPDEPFKDDKFNFLRPVIGYGPESMYVAYNPFYPPDLAHYEKRNASPDRSHNETFDALVITGGVGLVAYMVLFGSVFYYGLKWLGWINNRRERNIWLGLYLGGGLLGAVVLMVWQGVNFFGVGLPFGMVGGLVAYLIIYASFFYGASKEAEAPFTEKVVIGSREILLVALVSAILAHFVEIHFGIAIAATRTYFWVYAALVVLLGKNMLQQGPVTVSVPHRPSVPMGEPTPPPAKTSRKARQKKRRRSRQTSPQPRARASLSQSSGLPVWLGPVLASGLLLALIMGTLGFDFVTNSGHISVEDPTACNPQVGRLLAPCWSSKAWDIVKHDLTVLPARGRSRPEDTNSLMTLGLLGLTLMIGSVVSISEMARRGLFKRREDVGWGTLLLLFLAVIVTTVALFGIADRHLRLGVMQMTRDQTSMIGLIDDLLDVSMYLSSVLDALYVFAFSLILLVGLALLVGQRLSKTWATPWGVMAAIVLFFLALFIMNETNLKVIRADVVYKQGEEWSRQKQWDLAIAHHKRALEMAPNEDFYYLWAGSAYLEKSKSAPNEGCIITEDPAISAVLSMSVEKTSQLCRQDLLKFARTILLQARHVNPLNTDHTANLGRLYKNWADLDKANKAERINQSIGYYTQATRLSPQNTIIWNELATVHLYQLGDQETAREIVQHSLTLDDRFEQTYMIQGDSWIREVEPLFGQLAAKQAELQAAAEDEKDAIRQEIARLQDERDTGLEMAIASYRQALEIRPRTINIYTTIASAYEQMGRFKDAVATLNDAITINPKSHQTLIGLAQLYQRHNDPEQAVTHYRRATALAPKNASYRISLANLLEGLGRFDEALVEVREAANLKPEDASLRQSLAFMYQRLEMYPEALNEARAAAQMTPNDPTSQLLIGDLCRTVNDLACAAQAYEQALVIKPNLDNAWNVHLNLALIYQETGGQLDLALTHAVAALDTAPEGQRAGINDFVSQLQSLQGSP